MASPIATPELTEMCVYVCVCVCVCVHLGGGGGGLIRVIFHRGGLSSGGLSSGWSLTRVIFHQGCLSAGVHCMRSSM